MDTANLADLTDDQLRLLRQAAADILAIRAAGTTNDRILLVIPWRGENERRYGKPWIAKISGWDKPDSPELDWGTYYGSVAKGGELHIEAAPGSIIRWGQRDNRAPHKTENRWGILGPDGTVTQCEPAHARRHWLAARADA